MTVMSKMVYPNRMAKACRLPDYGPITTRWETEPIEKHPAPARNESRSLRVAIADDCRDGADSLAMVVRLWGHETQVAYGGAQALLMIKAYDPDVVFMDIAMPKVTGLDVAHEIRALPRFEHTMLIALTGYVDEVHRRLILAAGFDYFFAKPCEPQELKNTLLSCHQVRPRGVGVMAVV